MLAIYVYVLTLLGGLTAGLAAGPAPTSGARPPPSTPSCCWGRPPSPC